MRILLTGGTGLIGRALIGELVRSGHQCMVLSRNPRAAGFTDDVSVLEWDAKGSQPLADLMRGCEAVIHLAGESIGDGRWTAERKARIRHSRTQSTRAIAQAIAATASPPKVYVQASAVGFYGPRGDETIDESDAPGDDFLALTCVEWEASSQAIESVPVRRVLLRSGIVLSAAGGALPRMALPFRLCVGGRAGNGRQWMPWIHIADQVGAIRFLLETDAAAGPINLTAPQPVTNAAFSRTLGSVLKRPSLMPAPASALKLMLGEMSMLILTGQRAIPKRLQELGFEFRFPSLEPALADLLG